MKKLMFIALLLSLVSCSESDFRKIDKLLGLEPVPKDTMVLETEITIDSTPLQPFKTKPYDSAKVAKKMEVVKDNIFKPIPKNKKGKSIDQLLAQQDYAGRRSDAAFIKSRRKLLDSIWRINSKKAKSLTAKPDTGQ